MALLMSCAFIEKPKHRVSLANVSVGIFACAVSLWFRVFLFHDLTVLLLSALPQGRCISLVVKVADFFVSTEQQQDHILSIRTPLGALFFSEKCIP